MSVLADTSVWIDHWRHRNRRLADLLEQRSILVHPFVLGEIALGYVPARAQALQHLGALRAPTVARHADVLALIEQAQLWNRGLGWVDAHLVASALLDRLRLWTLDRALHTAAQRLGVAF